jgi:poly(3-hydroxybutyrate) depolymerase
MDGRSSGAQRGRGRAVRQLKHLLFFLPSLAASHAAAQQATGFLDRTVPFGDKPVRYQVYVPFDYTTKREWPVILFLHGAGERGNDGLLQTQVGLGAAIASRRTDSLPSSSCRRHQLKASGVGP